MKKSARICLGLICAAMGISGNGLASGNCQRLEVELSNNTANTCNIVGQQLIHGNFVDLHNTAPSIIWPGQMVSFELQQSEFYGPMIDLQYRCGQSTVQFLSAQGICFGYAGSVKATIEQQKNIQVNVIKLDPSKWYDTHGVIKWLLG